MVYFYKYNYKGLNYYFWLYSFKVIEELTRRFFHVFCLALYKEQIGILAHTTLENSHLMCAKQLWRPWSSALLVSLLIWFSWWAYYTITPDIHSTASINIIFMLLSEYSYSLCNWQNYIIVRERQPINLLCFFYFATSMQINACIPASNFLQQLVYVIYEYECN